MRFVVLFKNGNWGVVSAEGVDGAFASMPMVQDEIVAVVPGDQLYKKED